MRIKSLVLEVSTGKRIVLQRLPGRGPSSADGYVEGHYHLDGVVKYSTAWGMDAYREAAIRLLKVAGVTNDEFEITDLINAMKNVVSDRIIR